MLVTQREDYGVERHARRRPVAPRLLVGAAVAAAALAGTVLSGCGGDRVGAADAAAVVEPSGDARRQATAATVHTPTADDVTPELLARVAASTPATVAPVPPPTTTAPPVTEPPTTAPPEPPTTEPPPEPEPEPVEEAVPADPPTTEPPPPPTTEPPAPAAAWDTGAEASFVSLLNGQRAAVGLPALRVDGSLRASARGQVQWMIDHATLAHQDLHDDLAQGWAIVGENVGYGPNAGVIHNALVASPGHYANIVHTQYSSVGVGVQVDANGRMWVSQVFGG